MVTLEQIQKKLSYEIKHSNLSQSEIARRLGVRHTQISCYVHGKKMPALDTFANLCEILDLDANEILCIRRSESDRIKYSQTYVGEKIEVHNN